MAATLPPTDPPARVDSSSSTPSFPTLYAVNVAEWEPTDEYWSAALSLVQPEERERIGRFVHRVDAKRSLAGRLLARTLLLPALCLDTNDLLVLSRSRTGRPFVEIPSGTRVDFNISHAGSWVVGSVAPAGVDIGVDVVEVKALHGDLEGMLSDFAREFTPLELEAITSRAPNKDAQLEAFYKLWALKESYVKATGEGIGFGLTRLEFTAQQWFTTTDSSGGSGGGGGGGGGCGGGGGGCGGGGDGSGGYLGGKVGGRTTTGCSGSTGGDSGGGDSGGGCDGVRAADSGNVTVKVGSPQDMKYDEVRLKLDGKSVDDHWSFRLVSIDSSHLAAVGLHCVNGSGDAESSSGDCMERGWNAVDVQYLAVEELIQRLQ